MKPTLSKEEVEQLDEEELKAYINAVRSEEREQSRLLRNSASYWGRWSSGFIFIIIFMALSFSKLSTGSANTILCLATFIVVQIHAMGVNRRVDAAMRLLLLKEEEISD